MVEEVEEGGCERMRVARSREVREQEVVQRAVQAAEEGADIASAVGVGEIGRGGVKPLVCQSVVPGILAPESVISHLRRVVRH